MKTYELPFSRIDKLDDSLAEVIAKQGVEFDSQMVAEFHQCLLDNFTAPIGILVNKRNEYTYTFRAQRELASIPEIKAVAVVVYSEVSRKVTEAITAMPRESSWNLQIFDQRADAIEWLQKQLEVEKSSASIAT